MLIPFTFIGICCGSFLIDLFCYGMTHTLLLQSCLCWYSILLMQHAPVNTLFFVGVLILLQNSLTSFPFMYTLVLFLTVSIIFYKLRTVFNDQLLGVPCLFLLTFLLSKNIGLFFLYRFVSLPYAATEICVNLAITLIFLIYTYYKGRSGNRSLLFR